MGSNPISSTNSEEQVEKTLHLGRLAPGQLKTFAISGPGPVTVE